MTQPLSLSPNKVPPDLTVWAQHRKAELMSSINCIGIGTVQSFDSTDQTVTVSLNYLRVIQGGQAINPSETQQGVLTVDKIIPPEQMPQIVKCPLMILQGGGAYITFPVTAGDVAVILFNDRDIDNWWTTGSVVAPNTPRMHDLTDALCFIGVRALPNAIQNYFNGFKIQYAGTSLTIDPSGNITITGVDNSAFTITGNINITSPDNITITGASINLI